MNTEEKLAAIEAALRAQDEQLAELTDAHRALAVEHLAMSSVCKAMLPLIAADRTLTRVGLQAAYEQAAKELDSADADEQYRLAVLERIENWSVALGTTVYMAARRSPRVEP